MTMKEKVIAALQKLPDPELGIDLWTLGLIRGVEVSQDEEQVKITMTFTTPLCPYGPQMVADIKKMLIDLGARVADVEVVFDPPWEPPEGLREMLGV
jgi:metal-sulfur cluster biosynthetic enzyme